MHFRLTCIIGLVCAAIGCSDASDETPASVGETTESGQDQSVEISPTLDENAPFGVKVPVDLESCFAELDTMLPDSFISDLKAGTEDDTIQYHMNLGMWMRNNWGLWGGSELAAWFHDHGVHHPDDMSGIILTSYWRRLNGEPILFDEQAKAYQAYWEQQSQAQAQHQAGEALIDEVAESSEAYTTPDITVPKQPAIGVEHNETSN